jgi:putative component of membrane protein insertase Oxa1/YidC/SpoIIIJ protein YidD
MKKLAALGCAAALGIASAPAWAEEPWEPDPTGTITSPPAPRAPGYRPMADAALAAIELYRTEIGTQSIARCEFATSCSQFAHDAIDRRGFLVGMIVFIDRFFFRENQAAYDHYDWVLTPGGRIRLDDGGADY